MNLYRWISRILRKSQKNSVDLSKDEISALLNKIRADYSDYSKENPKAFHILPFEERYTQVLKTRADLASFLKVEIDYLEKLKKIHNQRKEKMEIVRSSPMDRILEEQERAIQHYPYNDFHPQGRRELKFFYGAILEYAERELILLQKIFKGTPEIKNIFDPILSLERLGVSKKGIPSLKISEHIKSILATNGNPLRIEQETQNLIKDGCIALKVICENLDISIKNKLVSSTAILSSEEVEGSETFQEYAGKTYEEILKQIYEKSSKIIKDFRMEGILSIKKP